MTYCPECGETACFCERGAKRPTIIFNGMTSDDVTDEMLNAGQERLCEISNATFFDDAAQAEIFAAMFNAIADTHPKDGDVEQAPLVSGGGAEGNRPESTMTTLSSHKYSMKGYSGE